MPLPTGGSRKVLDGTPARVRFSFWPTPAAAIVIAATPGRRSFSPNWPTLLPWLLPSPTIQPELPNGTRSNIVSSLRCRGTGLGNRWTPIKRSSTTPVPPQPKPALPSPPTWIAATIHAASNLHTNKSHHYDCTAMRRCRPGTTPSSLNCEVVFAAGLSSPLFRRRYTDWPVRF